MLHYNYTGTKQGCGCEVFKPGSYHPAVTSLVDSSYAPLQWTNQAERPALSSFYQGDNL